MAKREVVHGTVGDAERRDRVRRHGHRWHPRPADTLFGYLERGKTLDEFLYQFPTVSRETAVAILEMAKEGMLT